MRKRKALGKQSMLQELFPLEPIAFTLDTALDSLVVDDVRVYTDKIYPVQGGTISVSSAIYEKDYYAMPSLVIIMNDKFTVLANSSELQEAARLHDAGIPEVVFINHDTMEMGHSVKTDRVDENGWFIFEWTDTSLTKGIDSITFGKINVNVPARVFNEAKPVSIERTLYSGSVS